MAARCGRILKCSIALSVMLAESGMVKQSELSIKKLSPIAVLLEERIHVVINTNKILKINIEPDFVAGADPITAV